MVFRHLSFMVFRLTLKLSDALRCFQTGCQLEFFVAGKLSMMSDASSLDTGTSELGDSYLQFRYPCKQCKG